MHCRGQFPSGTIVWAAVLLSVASAISSNAQAQTWYFSGYWVDDANPDYPSCEMWLTPDGGGYSATYKCGGGGGNQDYYTSWTVERIEGDTIYLTGGSGHGKTATGWMTPTHHHVSYQPGNGSIEGDGNNTPSQNVSIDSFVANPGSITDGASSTLSWTTTNATRVYIDNSVGDVAGDGSRQVWPGSTTTYTLTAEGTNGPVSRQVTVSVSTPPPPPGPGTGILKEVWTDIGSGTAVSDLIASQGYPDNPSSSETASSFDGQISWADNYGTRFRGYVIAPVTGQYVFMLSSDDASVLYLSYDQNPANAGEIARIDSWCPPDDWSHASGGVSLAQGQRYYVEALHKEGGGGDHIRVGWQMPGGAVEAPIPGHRLDPFVPTPPADPVTIDSFGANPGTIDYGASSTLSWTTSNATRVYIDNSIGDVAGDGSRQVSPGSTTTYTLTAEGRDGPVSQQVMVTVNPPPPDDVRIDYFTADPAAIQSGGSSTLSWGTTNATAVTLDGAGVNISGSQTVQPGGTTTYTLVADGTNGPVSRQVTVTVETGGGPVTVPFRMNCGPNAQDSGWESDDAYVSGGSDYLFDGGVDKSGVTDPAPDGVYLSVRHADPAFGVPIANGSYKVRLHFFDAYGDDSVDGREINVTIEGVEVLSGYSVKAAAGGTSKAVVEEFDVSVDDGSLTIVLDRASGNDAFVSGVEVLEQGAPPVPVLTSIVVTPSSATVYASNTCTFDADTLDQYGAPISAAVSWTVSGGGSMSGSTFASDGTPGTFTVTASSGGVSGTASVTVQAVTDTDYDGMDDAWEIQEFGDLSQGASDDYDQDGYSNLEEFNAGTDPTNALSMPGTSSALTGFSCSAGGGAAAGLALAMLAVAAALRQKAARSAA